MPTYEYACKKCGEHFDVVQSFADEPLKRHRGGCGGAVKRVFGSVGISFKGSGFYKNDSRSSSSSSNGGGSTSSSDKTETKTETKSDSGSKPEAKSSDKKSDSKAPSTTSKP